jgi:hypothetical protein
MYCTSSTSSTNNYSTSVVVVLYPQYSTVLGYSTISSVLYCTTVLYYNDTVLPVLFLTCTVELIGTQHMYTVPGTGTRLTTPLWAEPYSSSTWYLVQDWELYILTVSQQETK